MIRTNNLFGLIEVNKNKIKHSKYVKSNLNESYYFDDLNVKIEERRLFTPPKPYLNKFKPFLYYEWSKRKYEGDDAGGYMCVNCTAIRVERVYTTIFFNNFYFDTTNFLKQIDERNEELNQLAFFDLELNFFILDPIEAYEGMFLKDLCNLKAREIDLPFFLINQLHPDTEYSLILETDFNEFREEGEEQEPKRKIINSIESYKSDECVICFIEKPNIIFCNCGHIAICAKCNELIKNEKCPICRQLNTIKRKIDF